jgi:hypothetical protein
MHAATTTSLLQEFELLPAHLSEPVCTIITETIMATDMAVSISSYSHFELYPCAHTSPLSPDTQPMSLESVNEGLVANEIKSNAEYKFPQICNAVTRRSTQSS